MSAAAIHPEDVKAALRKRHGTLRKFAETRGLKQQAVADFLRGRTSKPVADAIAAELQISPQALSFDQSRKLDDNAEVTGAHRLTAEAA
jgi:lambda repressor-like predicted transcriptional regulator